jgi:hypothetical protein
MCLIMTMESQQWDYYAKESYERNRYGSDQYKD